MIYTGIRPGEKIHEIMVSEEEIFRTSERNSYYVIHSILPDLRDNEEEFEPVLTGEYSSADDNIGRRLARIADECEQRDGIVQVRECNVSVLTGCRVSISLTRNFYQNYV